MSAQSRASSSGTEPSDGGGAAGLGGDAPPRALAEWADAEGEEVEGHDYSASSRSGVDAKGHPPSAVYDNDEDEAAMMGGGGSYPTDAGAETSSSAERPASAAGDVEEEAYDLR